MACDILLWFLGVLQYTIYRSVNMLLGITMLFVVNRYDILLGDVAVTWLYINLLYLYAMKVFVTVHVFQTVAWQYKEPRSCNRSRHVQKKNKVHKTKWQFRSDGDCGIYAMRHMDRYIEDAKNWSIVWISKSETNKRQP